VDVDSPAHDNLVQPAEYPEVSFVITDDEPLITTREVRERKERGEPVPRHGSEANGITLEIARSVFQQLSYSPRWFMTLQSDILATKQGWLEFLLSKMEERTAAVGVRGQPNFDKSEPILHSLGCLWRYELLQSLGLSLMPHFPKYDVAEAAISAVRRQGWSIVALPNTYSDPSIIERVPAPYRTIYSDRTLDENGDVIFMHLGRGVEKSVSGVTPQGKTSPEAWVEFARKTLFA
jgi:hypothetical protein